MKLKLIITSFFLLLFSFQGVSALSMVTPEPIPDSALEYTHTLRVGSPYYQDVMNLQIALQDLGLYTKSIDGKFGPGTKAAVMSYQKQNNLAPDGVAGPKTYWSLSRANIMCTMEYAPVCARVLTGLACIQAPCPGSETIKTYSNGCAAESDPNMIEVLYNGECTTVETEY